MTSHAARLERESRNRPECYVARRLALTDAVVSRLRATAAGEGASFDAVVVGAVAALLARYAVRSETAVVVEAEGGARLVRVELDDDPDARELIRRVTQARDHALPTDGRWRGHVLPAGGDADVRVVLGEGGASPSADLVVRTASGGVWVDVREGRFPQNVIERVTRHLRAEIEGLADFDGPIASIPIVDGEERAWILARSNALDVRFDECLPSVVEHFEEHARRTPHATALVDGRRVLTYAELDAAANALGRRLIARGLDDNPRVVVYLERGADAVIAFLGILKARGTYVPIDVGYPPGRAAAILSCAAPRVVVTRAGLAPALTAIAVAPVPPLFIDETGAAPAEDADAPRPPVRPDDVAYTIFTSGSTGEPKGVVVDHRSLANYARAAFDAYRVAHDDRVLHAASLGFDLSLEEIVVTLTAGAALVVRQAAPIASIQAFVDECAVHHLTVLSITSALWHELTMRLDDGTVTLPAHVRLVILGADVARPDVLAVWQRATAGSVRLVNSYGLTETTIVATVWEATVQPLEPDWRAVPIGRPLRNVSAYVLDANRELVPIGVVGEICVGGLAVASRYLGDERLTSARFVPDPFLPGRLMCRTGDRGVLRRTGELEFLGRADYQVKVNGVRIELGEIEARLREVSGVIEGIVVARKNHGGETELDAHVMAASADVTPESLRARLEATLPRAAVPARIHVVEKLPLTAAGKIDRRALAAAHRSKESANELADVTPPVTPMEELVVRTVAEVLGRARVGVLDHFTRLGGTSLSAVRAASLLGRRLGRNVRAQIFFETPTLRHASAELASSPHGARDGAGPVCPAIRDAALDPAIVARAPAAGVPFAPEKTALGTALLTGATGFFGSFVLADLLRETAAHVICLVRAPSSDAARARLAASLDRRRCSIDAAAWARVTVLAADIEEPDFGLDAPTYRHLSETVDAVLHLGAHVNLMLPYATLRAANVVAVESVLRFATTRAPKTVHHVSTVEVLSDTDPSDPRALVERLAAASPERLHDGYAQSKWAAEKLVEAARERGVRAYVHRPGRLMGHSRTGVFNPDDVLVRILDACGQVGAAPQLDVTVDVTPVDDASRAFVQLANGGCRDAATATFHLVHPERKTWSSLVDDVVAAGAPLRLVPHAEWRALVEARAESRRRVDSSPDFLPYLASMSRDETEGAVRGGYAADATRAALGPGFVHAPLDARLVAIYLRALAAEGRFPALAAPARRSGAAAR